MRLQSLTGIGRAIDPRHPSNLYVVVASALAAAAVFVVRIAGGGADPVLWGFRAGAVVFIGWALGRELDPDDTWTAGIAGPLALVGFVWAPPALGALGAMLITGRIIVRTTGLSPTVVDSALLVLAAGYLGASPVAWPAAVALIGGLALDRYVAPRGPARLVVTAALAGAALVVVAVLSGTGPVWSPPSAWGWAVVGLVAVAGIMAVPARAPRSVGDFTGRPLDHRRLVIGRGAATGVFAATVALTGATALGSMGPLAAALVATSFVSMARRSTVDRRAQKSALAS